MYRLLIVDDEAYVVDGLVEIFEGLEGYPLDVYKAHSAEEALALMNRVRVDVVITDVNMPGMDGMEFHRRIQNNFPFCKVIYLTGHNLVEYAQSAIRNEGTDFVLKTEDESKIIAAFQRAVTALEREATNQRYVEKANRQMETALPLLQRKFLLDLLDGEECPAEERAGLFSELRIPLNPYVGIFPLLGRVDGWQNGARFTSRIKLLYLAQSVAAQRLSGVVDVLAVQLEDSILLWLFQPKDVRVRGDDFRIEKDVWQRAVSFVSGSMDGLQEILRKVTGIPFSFVVGSVPTSWENLPNMLGRMLLNLNRTAGLEGEALLVDDGEAGFGPERTGGPPLHAELSRVDQLSADLLEGRREAFFSLLDELFQSLRERCATDANIDAGIYYALATVFLSYLYKSRLISQPEIRMNVALEKLINVSAHASWTEVRGFFESLADYLFEQRAADYLMSTKKMIEKVYGYIEDHYDQDLSLNKLAEISRFSPSYLSRMYKQIVGKSISEHIVEVKLQKSKEMLLRSEMKIGEIAQLMGFSTPSYFTFFFKKRMNMSPQEYRESNAAAGLSARADAPEKDNRLKGMTTDKDRPLQDAMI